MGGMEALEGKRVAAARRFVRKKGKYLAEHKNRGMVRLVICAAVFVLIVALKLLFPQTIADLSRQASGLLGRNADFREAFAAVGRAVSGEDSVEDSIQEAYAAVFGSLNTDVARSNKVPQGYILRGPGESLAAAALRPATETMEASREDTEQREGDLQDAQTFSEVYRLPELPENASLSQLSLGFSYTSPVRGTLTSTFGWREHPTEGSSRFHYGIDIAAEKGAEIVAFADGEVYAVGDSSTLGQYIILQHSGGYKTLYAHCSEILVTQGSVKMGTLIARVGETGNVTGAHLHFELQNGTMYFNPIYYVAVW